MTLLGVNGRPLQKAKPKRTAPEGEPIVETTHAENLAARKFLGFALHDIRYQLEMMSRDTKVSRVTFENSKQTALVLSQYLSGLVQELDRLIAEVEGKQTAAETARAAVN